MSIIPRTKAARKSFWSKARGRVGLAVFKQYKDKTVISNVPDMSRVKRTTKQKQHNKEFARAQRFARHVHEDPILKERYTQMHNESPRRFRSLYNFVVSLTRQRLKEEWLQGEAETEN